MEFLRVLIKKDIFKKLLVLALIALVLYLLRGLLNLLLLTFLFTYITYSVQGGIDSKLRKYIKVKPAILTLFIYIIMFCIIFFVIYKYVPKMLVQIGGIIGEISRFDFESFLGGDIISKYALPYIKDIDIAKFTKDINLDQLFGYISNVGTWSFNVFVSFILSFFFMVEKDKIKIFFKQFEKSRIRNVYSYCKTFSYSFMNSFGKVISAQILIATVNSILSVIALWIMGFPQLLGLWVMIFIFSLVPVAGVIASLIPLSIIAYTVGGFIEILYVLILIAILHAIESYLLNPKLMAYKTELPVFIIFITLIISEYFMGVWGLLLGVPLLIFALELISLDSKI